MFRPGHKNAWSKLMDEIFFVVREVVDLNDKGIDENERDVRITFREDSEIDSNMEVRRVDEYYSSVPEAVIAVDGVRTKEEAFERNKHLMQEMVDKYTRLSIVVRFKVSVAPPRKFGSR